MKRIFYLLSICLVFLSCEKEKVKDDGFWDVKYEVTSSNSNAKIFISYKTESGGWGSAGTSSGNFIPVPWSYEAKWSKDPGMSASRDLVASILMFSGVSNSTAFTMKIYVDGKMVTSSNSEYISYTLH
jgi:hypothetical protein